jgi:hypothetical protein
MITIRWPYNTNQFTNGLFPVLPKCYPSVTVNPKWCDLAHTGLSFVSLLRRAHNQHYTTFSQAGPFITLRAHFFLVLALFGAKWDARIYA